MCFHVNDEKLLEHNGPLFLSIYFGAPIHGQMPNKRVGGLHKSRFLAACFLLQGPQGFTVIMAATANLRITMVFLLLNNSSQIPVYLWMFGCCHFSSSNSIMSASFKYIVSRFLKQLLI